MGFLYEGHQLAASQNPDLRAVLEAVNTPESLAQVRALTGFQDITHAVRPRAIAVAIFSPATKMIFPGKLGAWPMS